MLTLLGIGFILLCGVTIALENTDWYWELVNGWIEEDDQCITSDS